MKVVPPRPLSLRPFAIRGFALVGLALTSAGCDKHALPVSKHATPSDTFALTAEWPAFAQEPATKADILFMVDDSSSMKPLQAKLAAGFSQFMTALEHLPGGVPDLHIGVVSSSMGAGQNPTVSLCPPGGDQGILHNAPLGPTCTGMQLADRFIAVHTDAASGQLVTNYGSAPLADAFGCIAALGDNGCGLEHQAESVLRALGLDGAPGPSENAGFLRQDAFLAVVLITNEDDCSAPPDSHLFDSTSATVSDPLGPLQSYRCNEFGHQCLINGKLQHPPRNMSTGELQGCRSAEDGRLIRVSDMADALRTLKGDPARLFVAAVTGPATPYVVGLGPSQIIGDPEMWPSVQHSCTNIEKDGSVTYADPAVRISQLVGSFGAHGLLASICNDTMGPILNMISTRFSQPMSAACVPTPAPTGPGCTVVDRTVGDTGKIATRLPACDDAGGATPCWRLVDDVAACGAGSQRLEVDRGGGTAKGTVTAIDCTTEHP